MCRSWAGPSRKRPRRFAAVLPPPPPLGPAFQGAGGPDFRRVGYEFDLDPESVQEIPTAVAHSMAEDEADEQEEDRERHTNYLMEVGGVPCLVMKRRCSMLGLVGCCDWLVG